MLVFFWFYDSFLPLDTSACESNKLYKLLCCDIDVVLLSVLLLGNKLYKLLCCDIDVVLLSVLLLGNNCNIRLLCKYHLSGGEILQLLVDSDSNTLPGFNKGFA